MAIHELKNAKISFISLVDKGANGKDFAIKKEAEQKPVIKISKSDATKQIVYGVVYEPDAVDAHGDFMTEEEIEKAAHLFMEQKNNHNIDKQHDCEGDEGFVIESWVSKEDGKLGDQDIKKGTWCVGVKVTGTDTWSAIEKGEINGFSMFGKGERVEVETKDTAFFTKALNGIQKSIESLTNMISKGAVKDKFDDNKKSSDFWNAWDAFCSVTRRYDWSTDRYVFEQDQTKVDEAIADFADILTNLLSVQNENVQKAGKSISAKNQKLIDDAVNALTALNGDNAVDVSEEEAGMNEQVTKALEEITKQMGELKTELTELKKESQPEGAETEQKDDVTKALENVTKEISELKNEVQMIKSIRGSSAQETNEQTTVVKSNKPSYMAMFQ